MRDKRREDGEVFKSAKVFNSSVSVVIVGRSSGEEPEVHSPLFNLMPTGRRQNQKSDIDERLFLWDWTRAETRTLHRVWNASSWRRKGTSFSLSLSCLCQRSLRWMFVRGSVVEPMFQRGDDETARRLFKGIRHPKSVFISATAWRKDVCTESLRWDLKCFFCDLNITNVFWLKYILLFGGFKDEAGDVFVRSGSLTHRWCHHRFPVSLWRQPFPLRTTCP